MGTVHQLAPAAAGITLGEAVSTYLATLAGAEQAGARKVYSRPLRPQRGPRARTAARPSMVRSDISARSNSAIAQAS